MIQLRHFDSGDIELVSLIFNVSLEKAGLMIESFNSGAYNGSYFEMFAIKNCDDNNVVGTISLYEHSKSVISFGPEIFKEYRRRGHAKTAMSEVAKIAADKNYRIVFQQVRTDNEASIKLHESLGFEKDGCVYKNQKGNDMYIFLKSL